MNSNEKEINARVHFKLNDILSALENQVSLNWNLALQVDSQKHAYYWEAFKKLVDIFKKEAVMALPYDSLSEQRKKEKRNIAVGKLDHLLKSRGVQGQPISSIVRIIEDAQNF